MLQSRIRQSPPLGPPRYSGECGSGEDGMTDFYDRARSSGREQRRRRRTKRKRPELSSEEQAYREAGRRADRKISFVRHLVAYSFVLAFLMVVTRTVYVPAIVGLAWGIGLSLHFFQAILAPELRKKWIQSEVERQVQRSATRRRREFSGEKTRSLEELSASIAHEIRNPITAAKSLVQQMGEDPASNENVEYAAVALEELDRVEKSISHLLRYAREEGMQLHTLQLEEVVSSALETLRDRFEKCGVELECTADTRCEMEGDAEMLRRVFLNLVGNAIDALTESGMPDRRISIDVGENLAGSEVWASVKDNGPGIDPELQDKIFAPFFTSRPDGTGLGLAITRKLVDAHGGGIELTSEPGRGTEFLVTFPKTQNGGGSR